MVIFWFETLEFNCEVQLKVLQKQGKNYYIWSTKCLQIVFILILMNCWMSNYVDNTCHNPCIPAM